VRAALGGRWWAVGCLGLGADATNELLLLLPTARQFFGAVPS
jgi:hypothetical protein